MDTIFDPLRKMEVARTPEEEVRQSVIFWLNAEKGIPLVMMSSEYAFQYNSMTYRADIVVFGRDMRPLMMVECKAPSVRLDRKVCFSPTVSVCISARGQETDQNTDF